MPVHLAERLVGDVTFGPETAIADNVLTVNSLELTGAVQDSDVRIRTVHVHLARPGETTRLVCIKDVVEPRRKATGPEPNAEWIHILKNVALTTCGQIVGFQEGIIDMSGPGAAYSPFSRLHHVVLEIDVVEGLGAHAHEEVVRHAGLRGAEYLARKTASDEPQEVRAITRAELPDDSKLPRVVYLYLLLSQGLLHDTYVFGENANEGLPRRIEPEALFDNAIVSGNCVSACDKNTTYHHQNNPVVEELLRRHGRDLNFVGVVLTNEPTRLAAKEYSARQAVKEVRSLQADGVIISKEGFGNPDADLMMLIRDLENAGIKTVAITDEFAGAEGASQSLADTTPEANALVSTGNANERVRLPPMERTIGPVKDVSQLAGAFPRTLLADGSLEIELQAIVGATNQLGYNRLSCRGV